MTGRSSSASARPSTGWTSASVPSTSAIGATRSTSDPGLWFGARCRHRFPGGERALLLRSLADAAALRDAAPTAASAVVIGSGFIGCEAAASLALRGMPVTLVAPEPLPQEKRLGSDAAQRLRDLVSEAGARHVGGVAVEEITDAGVRLDNGVTIDCDLVLAATGVAPQSRIAAEAGLQFRDSRIVVGSDMATSAPGVYAAGDVALARTRGRRTPPRRSNTGRTPSTRARSPEPRAAATPTKWDGVPGFGLPSATRR